MTRERYIVWDERTNRFVEKIVTNNEVIAENKNEEKQYTYTKKNLLKTGIIGVLLFPFLGMGSVYAAAAEIGKQYRRMNMERAPENSPERQKLDKIHAKEIEQYQKEQAKVTKRRERRKIFLNNIKNKISDIGLTGIAYGYKGIKNIPSRVKKFEQKLSEKIEKIDNNQNRK